MALNDGQSSTDHDALVVAPQVRVQAAIQPHDIDVGSAARSRLISMGLDPAQHLVGRLARAEQEAQFGMAGRGAGAAIVVRATYEA
jgi:hypothetical protein